MESYQVRQWTTTDQCYNTALTTRYLILKILYLTQTGHKLLLIFGRLNNRKCIRPVIGQHDGAVL